MPKTKFDYFQTEDDEVTFTLIDENTVKRLQKDGTITLPQKTVDATKDMRWNMKQLNSKLLQGIMNGDPIPKIAESFEDVIGKNEVSTTRAARTMCTNAENSGRLDSYKNLESQGVIQKKVWIATPDIHTRDAHMEADGQEVDIDEPFILINTDGSECEMMFPADPDGDDEQVWNCRCSMRTHIVGFRNSDGSVSKVDYGRDKTTHADQMAEEKERRQAVAQAKAEEKKRREQISEQKAVSDGKKQTELHTNDQEAYETLKQTLAVNGVVENKVKLLEEPLTSDEIIEKLAGGDMTEGSCASLSLAYAGNNAGIDVTDYRGGISRKTFSRESNIENALKSANADMQIFEVKTEAKETAKILKDLPQDGTEYILSAGKHAAIVRNDVENGLQYLEMQSAESNGWKSFESVYKSVFTGIEYKNTVADTLNSRFGCKKSANRPISLGYGQKLEVKSKIMLARVDSVQATEEFKDVLGFLNTDTDKQKKGASGSVK